ncbi:MAG: hypothetical protein QOI20_958 [Acidimicrobiaceae bacterium]|jgi:hypothetical protein|nr:hypothetical protein [Acidimicrobiaceae bacterium]
MSANGGEQRPPGRMAGAMVLMSVLLVFAIGVGVGYVIGRASG